MNILNKSINKKALLFVVLLILLSNLGFFTTKFIILIDGNQKQLQSHSLKENSEITLSEKTCNFSKYNLLTQISKLQDSNTHKAKVNFYEHPSTVLCHGRPVVSSTILGVQELNQVESIYIGVGVNTDIDNFEKIGKFFLVFFIICFVLSKLKLSYKKVKFNIRDFTAMLLILIGYSFFVHTSLLNALSNFLIYVIFGNIIFLYTTSFFEDTLIFKSLTCLAIFPFMFNDSNISFFWMLLLFTFKEKRILDIKVSKYIFGLAALLSIPFFYNLQYYNFSKPRYYADWSLFKSGRHQGGLVDFNNGLQSIVYLIDILLIIFLFYVLVSKYSKTKNFMNNFYDSLIYGFLIWFTAYFVSIINPIFNFLIFKSFGLNENIDTINSYSPEIGMNWRGVTSSHELTGFWIAIICSLIIYRYLQTKKAFYIVFLIFALISISFNTQRTAFLILFFLTTYLFSINIKQSNFSKIMILTISISIFVLIPFGINRLFERVVNIDFQTVEFNSFHRASIKITQARHTDYNLEIPLASDITTFEEYKSFNNFYSEVLNIKNQYVVDSIIFTSKVFGREMQWSRFLHFNDHIDNQWIFGKGPGQSYQFLDILIEKPHSLYLSTYYQYGYFGIIVLFFTLICAIRGLFVSRNFNYLLLIMFFINAIKSEFIFTHNQIVYFILFTSVTFLASKDQK